MLEGFRFLTLSSQVRAMLRQSKAWVDGLRKAASELRIESKASTP